MTRWRPARPARLFKSDQPGLADGAQARDFIWVGDVVDVMLWLLDTPGGQRLVQPGHRAGADLSGPGACGLRCGGKAPQGRVHRHAREPARAVSVLHPGADGPVAGGRLRRASSRRWRKGVRRYVQDYLARPDPPDRSDDPGPAVSAIRPGHRPDRAVRASAGTRWPISPAWCSAGGCCAVWCGWPRGRHAVQVDDFLTWATLGVVLGGRLGYVLFYQPASIWRIPLHILAVWDGGMSFHGGMLGVAIAIIVFCRREQHPAAGLRRPHRRRARRSGWGWAASPISSMASCGAARRRTGCPGR